MRIPLLLFLLLISCDWSVNVVLAQHPQTVISNELITSKVYLPDAKAGYYRGTRFDWSGVIHSLTHDGHEYFGEWQDSDDPYLHDRITGPVDSFETDTEIEDGETFLRIGVGVCAKQEEGSQSKHPFRVVNHGVWKTASGANWIEFTHDVTDDATQLGYHYVKRLTLTPGQPELIIDHTLTNAGRKELASEVYNHNFFVMDNEPTGPDFVVHFPFKPVADRDLKGIAALREKDLTFSREMKDGENIFANLTGFGSSDEDNQFTIENRKTGAGVRAEIDRPLGRIRVWSPRTTVCPEPFVNLKLQPNQSDRWSIRYTFYTLDQ